MKRLQNLIVTVMLLSISACSLLPQTEPKGLMLPESTFQQVKQNIASDAKTQESLQRLSQKGQDLLEASEETQPFQLPADSVFEFGWCDSNPPNNSLGRLVRTLSEQSTHWRELSQLYLFTHQPELLRKSANDLLSWARSGDLFNGYELGMEPEQAWFPGREEGFCNRSWHMMLDSIWQTYALINASQAYWVLDRHSSGVTNKEKDEIRDWIKKDLVPAVNAGFHAWTRWADAHPNSQAYERYRSDNHLPWSLVGLAAAGFALGDEELLAYVYSGGSYDDGFSGPYQNPSSFGAVIANAIKAGGEVYDEKIRNVHNKGFSYAMFSLTAQSMMAHMMEVHNQDRSCWFFKSPEGGSIIEALRHYAPFVAGQQELPNPNEKTNPRFSRFIYRMLLTKPWLSDADRALFTEAASLELPAQNFTQGLGDIELLFPLPAD